jgi:hypothetical protein
MTIDHSGGPETQGKSGGGGKNLARRTDGDGTLPGAARGFKRAGKTVAIQDWDAQDPSNKALEFIHSYRLY